MVMRGGMLTIIVKLCHISALFTAQVYEGAIIMELSSRSQKHCKRLFVIIWKLCVWREPRRRASRSSLFHYFSRFPEFLVKITPSETTSHSPNTTECWDNGWRFSYSLTFCPLFQKTDLARYMLYTPMTYLRNSPVSRSPFRSTDCIFCRLLFDVRVICTVKSAKGQFGRTHQPPSS